MSRFASVILSSTASLVLTLALAGCGDDAAEAGEESSTPAASTPAGSAATGGGADDGLCDVLAISDVADSFGVEIATDSVGAGSSNENDVVWKYTTCTWETDDVIEVRLAVSVADDFPGGELACPPLSYLGTEGEPVAGLEARAWWVESGFNEEEGTLRVCTDTHTFDIDADRPLGDIDLATLRAQTVELAGKVLTALG